MRKPSFLSGVQPHQIKPASFSAHREEVAPRPFLDRATQPTQPAIAAAPPLPPLAGSQAQHSSQAQAHGEGLEKLAAAIEVLRLRGERLAEEARADTLEIAFQIARRIVEAELRTGPDALFALVRSALRRCGEVRRVLIRVCPADLAILEGAAGKAALPTMTVARIDLVGDATLRSGDCVVESAEARVDGRLATRFAELRRAVDPDAEEPL